MTGLPPGRDAAAVMVCLLALLGWSGVSEASVAERWTEPGYGLTLDLPDQADPIHPPPPESLAAWRSRDGSYLRVRIVESNVAIVGFETTQALGWVGLTVAEPESVWLDDRQIAGRPGLMQVVELTEAPSKFLPPSVDGDRQTYGQAMAKLDPYRVAVLELFVPGHHAEIMQERLGTLADALSLVSPATLFEQRRAEVHAAALFLKGLDREAVLAGLPPRLDYDIAPADGGPGVRGEARRIVVTDPDEVARLEVAAGTEGIAVGWTAGMADATHERLVVRDEAWLSSDAGTEVWTRLQGSGILREGNAALGQASLASDLSQTLRTGVRNGSAIDVIVTKPRGEARVALREEKRWTIPERLPPSLIDQRPIDVQPVQVFLSRLDVLLLPELLPRDRPADYAFYALDPEKLTLSLRLYRVDPRPDGGADITERPTPASAPVLHRIDAGGVRQEIRQPSGLLLRLRP